MNSSFIPYLAVEASAGSGKTFTLAIRYISLLFLEVEPSKILSLTFTNKASGEMNERITNILYELEEKDIELLEIVKNTGLSKDEIIDKKDKVLENFLKVTPKIMTIDKFFNQILRSFSLYAGLMPNFEIKESDDEEFFELFLKELDSENQLDSLVYLSLLEDMKETKIMDLFKTIEERNKPKDLESIDYSVKEYLEKKIVTNIERLKEIIDNCPNKTKTMENAFNIQSVEELASKTWLERESLNYRTFSKCFQEELDQILQDLKSELFRYYKLKEAFILERIYRLYEVYEKTSKRSKKNSGILNFSDVTYFVKKILGSIDKEFIYFRLDSRIEHILIDEFQDTSSTQLEILAPLIEEIIAGKGTPTTAESKSFFFVGDTKQSIYRFRGGDWRLFKKTEELYNLEHKTLKINYRSSKSVVEFNNEIFKSLYEDFTPQQSKMESKIGYVDVLFREDIEGSVLENLKDLQTRNVKGKDIAILVYTNDDSIKISDLIKENFPNLGVITDTSGKIINHRVNRAVIECIKYLYYKEEIYLKNFNSLIGMEPFSPLKEEIAKLEIMEKVSVIGRKIVESYDLFDNDPNLIKFFGILDNFIDVFNFISKIEKETTAIDKGASDGVSVLTIHKSKGLEFDHVIVCDRFSTRPPVNRDSLIFDYEESGRIFYRYKGRSFFDEEYKEALERQKELTKKDLVNSLYVALTRAKVGLNIISKEKNSSFEILGLEKKSVGEKERYIQEINETEILKDERIVLNSYGKQKEFLQNENDEIEGNFHSIYFGNAIHFSMEVVEKFDKDSLGVALEATKNRFGLYVDMKKVKKTLLNLIDDKKFQEITQGIVYKEQSVIINGKHFVIDLLCENGGEFIICDYKSGVFKEEHKIQVMSYIKAVKEIKKTENVKGLLCYIGEKFVNWVDV